MNSAQILYQDEILRHGRQPHNFGVLDGANLQMHGDSPICGDHMRIYLRVAEGHIADARFSSSACCALCKASASMMTDAIKGLSISAARQLRARFLAMVGSDAPGADGAAPEGAQLGALGVFERIREVPSRAECVSLSWNTLAAVLSTAGISPNRSPIAANQPADPPAGPPTMEIY